MSKSYLTIQQQTDGVGEWDDVRIVPGAFKFPGASDPTLSDWQPTGSGATFKVYEFNSNNEGFFSVQLPHSYKEGTDLSPHVHWTPRSRGAAESGKTVAWKVDYTITNINGAFVASATIDLTDTCDGTNEKHQLSGGADISGSTLTISAMIIGRVYRAAGDTWATNTAGNRPVLLELDFHYQKNSVGSTSESSK